MHRHHHECLNTAINTRPEHSPKTTFRSRLTPQSGSDTQDDPNGTTLPMSRTMIPSGSHPITPRSVSRMPLHASRNAPILFTYQRTITRRAFAHRENNTTTISRSSYLLAPALDLHHHTPVSHSQRSHAHNALQIDHSIPQSGIEWR